MNTPSRQEIANRCLAQIRQAWMEGKDDTPFILAAIEEATRTPDAALPPLNPNPERRNMQITIEVGADFEKRLDNQWEVEREIHADRWMWNWESMPQATGWKS